eukprot:1147995-Pelagomonas_calceolata.AAC.1
MLPATLQIPTSPFSSCFVVEETYGSFPVRDAIGKVISVKPKLRGLITHIGNNANNTVLSYSDRRESLNPRSPAAAFVYPMWQHVHLDKVTNRLIYDTALLSHMDPTSVYNTIKGIIPPELLTTDVD